MICESVLLNSTLSWRAWNLNMPISYDCHACIILIMFIFQLHWPCTWSFYPALASQTVQYLTSSGLSSLDKLLFEAETRKSGSATCRLCFFLKMKFDHHVKQFEQPFGTYLTNLWNHLIFVPVKPANGLLSFRGSASFAKTPCYKWSLAESWKMSVVDPVHEKVRSKDNGKPDKNEIHNVIFYISRVKVDK